MRSSRRTNCGPPLFVTRATKSRIASLVAPSFQDGSGGCSGVANTKFGVAGSLSISDHRVVMPRAAVRPRQFIAYVREWLRESRVTALSRRVGRATEQQVVNRVPGATLNR